MEKKILVVDDERVVRNVFENILRDEGYVPFLAVDAYEALKILKEENIQVMFIDLNLPGMNGLDLCKTIRKNNPGAYIYAITGYGSIFYKSKCMEVGFNDYFTKPLSSEVLIKAAEKAFEKINRKKNGTFFGECL